MTPQDILTAARYVLNDTVSTRYRNTDAELLGWVNDALDVMVGVLPQLFAATSAHACTAGAEQSPSFARLVAILDVQRITGGGAILRADKAALDAFRPGWYSDSSGAAVNWFPHQASPKKFLLYPPSANGQSVDVVFAQAPAALLIGDTIPVSDNYQPALVNFVVGMASSKDDEAVNSNRSAQAKADFVAMIKGA